MVGDFIVMNLFIAILLSSFEKHRLIITETKELEKAKEAANANANAEGGASEAVRLAYGRDTKPPDCRYGLTQAGSRLTTRATCLSKSRKWLLFGPMFLYSCHTWGCRDGYVQVVQP